MEEIWLCLSDLATGGGVPALSSLSRSPSSSVWLALGGGALGVALSAAESRRSPPSAGYAQLFSLWDARDSDVGAGLLAIPLFLAACAPTAKNLPDYLRRLRWLSSGLNAVCLAAAVIHYTAGGGQAADARGSWLDGAAGLKAFLAVTDVAFAAAGLGWPSQNREADAAARGAALALLAAVPSALRGLLAGPAPDWLLVAYTLALAQSVHVHACSARLALGNCLPCPVASPQRALMLVVAPALTVGFVERRGDPGHASVAVLAALALGVLEWVLWGKSGQHAE